MEANKTSSQVPADRRNVLSSGGELQKGTIQFKRFANDIAFRPTRPPEGLSGPELKPGFMVFSIEVDQSGAEYVAEWGNPCNQTTHCFLDHEN